MGVGTGCYTAIYYLDLRTCTTAVTGGSRCLCIPFRRDLAGWFHQDTVHEHPPGLTPGYAACTSTTKE